MNGDSAMNTGKAPDGTARTLWSRIGNEPATFVSVLAILLIAIVGFLSPILAPHDPLVVDLGAALRSPSGPHWMGTDDLGRDLLSRVMAGTAASLEVGLLSVALAMIVGIPLGLASGYSGGWVDHVIMRVVDALLAFPALVLALAITAALGPSLINVAIAIGLVYVPRFARLLRGLTLSLRTLEFIEAARVVGASTPRILVRHILPNASASIAVQASLSIGLAIVAEASLSFLGLGVQPPTPSWGGILKVGYAYMDLAPYLAIFPGIAIVVTVWAFVLLGERIGQGLDPRLRRMTRGE